MMSPISLSWFAQRYLDTVDSCLVSRFQDCCFAGALSSGSDVRLPMRNVKPAGGLFVWGGLSHGHDAHEGSSKIALISGERSLRSLISRPTAAATPSMKPKNRPATENKITRGTKRQQAGWAPSGWKLCLDHCGSLGWFGCIALEACRMPFARSQHRPTALRLDRALVSAKIFSRWGIKCRTDLSFARLVDGVIDAYALLDALSLPHRSSPGVR